MKTNKPFMTYISMLSLLMACANVYIPVVDMRGVNSQKYRSDLAVCRDYAAKYDAGGNNKTGALFGAGIGAGVGAILGAMTNNIFNGLFIGLIVGGVSGYNSGTTDSFERQKDLVGNCLTSRGYNVLG